MTWQAKCVRRTRSTCPRPLAPCELHRLMMRKFLDGKALRYNTTTVCAFLDHGCRCYTFQEYLQECFQLRFRFLHGTQRMPSEESFGFLQQPPYSSSKLRHRMPNGSNTVVVNF